MSKESDPTPVPVQTQQEVGLLVKHYRQQRFPLNLYKTRRRMVMQENAIFIYIHWWVSFLFHRLPNILLSLHTKNIHSSSQCPSNVERFLLTV